MNNIITFLRRIVAALFYGLLTIAAYSFQRLI